MEINDLGIKARGWHRDSPAYGNYELAHDDDTAMTDYACQTVQYPGIPGIQALAVDAPELQVVDG
jgi:hypothetical protein